MRRREIIFVEHCAQYPEHLNEFQTKFINSLVAARKAEVESGKFYGLTKKQLEKLVETYDEVNAKLASIYNSKENSK